MSTDAERHIQEIHQEKGVEEGPIQPSNVTNLNNALKIISEQLYSKPIHFVLEIIQNADDNQYEKQNPLLAFHYGDGWIQTRCNETGFTRDNVEAICNIGKSTKTAVTQERGFIGEKGIGFKSVFKEAQVVWLSSRGYSFKFVKSNTLGMINPIWDSFPRIRNLPKSEMTAIHMELQPSCNQEQLRDDLHELDANILLFLRRLKVLTITPSSELETRRERVKFSKRSLTQQNGQDVVELTTSTGGDKSSSTYIMVRKLCKRMPVDERRAGILSSEVILGFPVNADNEPITGPEFVYAFLPIRDYGFSFVIHADFLLVASREDIDTSRPWNSKLRSEVIDAFVEGVDRFNDSELKFTWPRYLRIYTLADTFFSNIVDEIVEELQTRDVLYSWDNDPQQLVVPSRLTFIPEVYRDDAGEPLLGSKADYLSPAYEFEDVSRFGVKIFTYDAFLIQLEAFIKDDFDTYRNKPDRWHCRVALALNQVVTLNAKVRSLQLIPLRNGEWVSGRQEGIYFEALSGGMRIPPDVKPCIVDPNACASNDRRSLFVSLGIGNLDLARACELIGDKHLRIDDHEMTLDALIAHASFLFRASKTMRKIPPIRFATETPYTHWGDELYLDLPNSSNPISSFFTRQSGKIIHPDYFKVYQDQLHIEWLEWLQNSQHISALPRLISVKLDITPEFRSLMEEKPIGVLKLLRDEWQTYVEDIGCYSNVKAELSTMSVLCKDGKTRALSKTFLPTVARANDSIPTVELPEPQDSKWERLELLGVSKSENLQYFLLLLKACRGRSSELEHVTRIYQGLQEHARRDRNLLKSTFREDRSVYVLSPVTQAGIWVGLGDCVWKAPACLKRPYPLSAVFPSCERLFCNVLGISNATIDTIMSEISSLPIVDTERDRIKEMLLLLDELLDGRSLKPSQSEILRSLAMFPVYRIARDGRKMDFFLSYNDMWCVSDQRYWTRAFDRNISLLDFREESIEKLSNLTRCLSLDDRKLSKLAVEDTICIGDVSLHEDFTNLLRSKAALILRLVSTGIRASYFQQLRNFMVYSATDVVLTRRMTYPNAQRTVVEGVDGYGTVVLKRETDAFKAYMSADDITSRQHLAMNKFAHELADALEISQTEKIDILACIVASDDLERLEQELDKMDVAPAIFSVPNEAVLSRNANLTTINRFKNTAKGDHSEDSSSTPSSSSMPSSLELEYNAPTPQSALSSSPDHTRTARSPATPTRNQAPTTSAGLVKTNKMFRRSFGSPSPRYDALDLTTLDMLASNFDPTSLSLRADQSTTEIFSNSRSVTELSNNTQANKSPENPNTQLPTSVRAFTPPSSDFTFNFGELAAALPSLGSPSSIRTFRRSSRGSSPQSFRVGRYAQDNLPTPRDGSQYTIDQDIGFRGEYYIYKILHRILETRLEQRHWTSKLRAKAHLPPFTQSEGGFSDFTYEDSDSTLTQYLVGRGWARANDWIGHPVTYHLEVKSTTEGREDPFFMSYNQFQMARRWALSPNTIPSDVYVIVRVYGVNSDDIQFTLYQDPWNMFLADELRFIPQGSFVVETTF